jgi:hypothetical protein
LTTPNITINVSELLNTEKLSAETTRLFRSVLGFNEPTVAEEGEKLTAESEPREVEEEEVVLEGYNEALRLLQKAENSADKGQYTDSNQYLQIVDRYIRLQ